MDDLTTTEAAVALGLSRKTILAHLASGLLKGRRIGTGKRCMWLVPASEVTRYQRERKPAGRPPHQITKLQEEV